MKTFFCTAFLILSVTGGFSEPVQVYWSDTVPQQVKSFNVKTIAANSTGRDFNYEVTPEKEGGLLSILAYYWSRLMDKTSEVKWHNLTLYDVLLYGLIIFAAVMIVLQLFKVQIQGLFKREPNTIVQYKSEVENVFETDFDALIKQATGNKNYRLAIRLLYLQSLRKLSDAGLIRWQKNKTNFEYYYELKDENLRRQFYDLTLAFEYSWYGHVDVQQDTFDQKAASFSGFLRSIRN